MATERRSLEIERVRTEIRLQIAAAHSVPAEEILFLDKRRPTKPWLTYKHLIKIALKMPEVTAIYETFDKSIPESNQVVHVATVTRTTGPVISLSGVATVGEKVPGLDPSEEFDEHELARSRALHATLEAAGVDPFPPPETIKPVATMVEEGDSIIGARERQADLARIHILAPEVGLVAINADQILDWSPYYSWLFAWGVRVLKREVKSSSELNEQERKLLINALEQIRPEVRGQ